MSKTMLELKQDDWIEACKEIDVLNSKLTLVEAQLAEALEVMVSVRSNIGFGGNENLESALLKITTLLTKIKEMGTK